MLAAETNANSSAIVANGLAAFGWQDLIGVAPHTLALLGQIMVVGGKKDFSLISDIFQTKFEFIKYPSSFKATLSQLGNEGLIAFQNAEKKMIQIQLSLTQIPAKVRQANDIMKDTGIPVKLLPTVIKPPINSLNTLVTSCVNSAQAAEEEFSRVQKLLLEILEATQMKQGEQERKKEEIERSLEAEKQKRQTLQEINSLAEKEMREAEEEYKTAKKDFDQAIKDIPSGWNLLAQQLVKLAANVASNVLTAKSSILNRVNGMSITQDPEIIKQNILKQSQIDGVLTLHQELVSFEEIVTNFMTPSSNTSLNVKDHNASNLQKAAETVKIVLLGKEQRLQKTVTSPQGTAVKAKAVGMMGQLKEIFSMFFELKDGDQLEKNVQDIIQKLQDWKKNFAPLIDECNALNAATLNNSGAAPTMPPNSEKTIEERKAELLRMELGRADQRAADARQSYIQLKMDLTNILNEINKLNITQLDLSEIISICQKALVYLEKLKENWVRLLKFFTILSSITNSTLKVGVDEFKELVTSLSESGESVQVSAILNLLQCSEYTILEVSFLVVIWNGG